MKPVFFTAAYHSRDPHAAWELEELENALCRRAQELRDCDTGSINLSAPELGERPAWIQPVLLFDGVGQRKLEMFPQAVLGRPLLESEADFSPLLAALRLPNRRQTLLLGHGGEGAAPVLRALSAWLQKRGEPVSAAALRGEPGWEEAIAWLSPGKEVLLVPLLLTAGVHLQRDVSLWQDRLTEAGFFVTVRQEGLVSLPGVREMFLKRVETLLSRGGTEKW